MDNIFYDKRIIVCPICHNRIDPYENSAVAKAYQNICRGHGWCPFCGWELTLYTNSFDLSKNLRLPVEISSHFPSYEWRTHGMKGNWYATDHINSSDIVVLDAKLDEFVHLRRGETGIIVSRPENGEIQFVAPMIDRLGENLELIDLYSDTRKLTTLCPSRGVRYKTLSEIDLKYKDTPMTRFCKLVTSIRDMDHPDYIILFGIQAVQENPFEPEEMRKILKELKALAVEKDTTIVIYSGLLSDCYDHTPSKEDLEKIGIDEPLFNLVAALKNYRVVYYGGNQAKPEI